MLTTYDRILAEYRRKVRLEAALCYRESDRRAQDDVLTWTRYRPMVTESEHRSEAPYASDREERHDAQ